VSSRWRAELRAADDPALRAVFGRTVVDGKVRKQAVVLQRLARRHNAELVATTIEQLRQLLAMLPEATGRDELMGLEGAAARAYFAALGDLLPEEFGFTGRTRQPPLDVVNAALSYGHTILVGEAVSALCAAGLDPNIGLLHADDDHRPALALDLMEEFRPLIVDQVVLAAVNRHELRPEHGRREEDSAGVLLTRAGREALIDGDERRMLQSTRGALAGFSGSLRRRLYRQAERLTALVSGLDGDWNGLSWR
jgi:CRISP-associated protein Cas1